MLKFVLAPTKAYWWPVTVSLPDPDNAGQVIVQRLKLLFEPRDQEAEIVERERIAAIRDSVAQAKAERAMLAAVVKGWDDVETRDGTVVPFTPEVLDQALRQPWFRRAAWTAYYESLSGEAARLGN